MSIRKRTATATLVLALAAFGAFPAAASATGSHESSAVGPLPATGLSFDASARSGACDTGNTCGLAATASVAATDAHLIPPDLATIAESSAIARRIADTADLPQPLWWTGPCNVGRHAGAFALGASFRGVQACGPQPGRTDGRIVSFFPGAWGEQEWQCTELVYRFMYLAYGVVPYNGNGDQVVDHYRPTYGGNLVKVTNGSGELPVAGDVLSYVSIHTSIVTKVAVNLVGDGTIQVLEQNAPNDGHAMLAVSHGRIAGVKNWLHHTVD